MGLLIIGFAALVALIVTLIVRRAHVEPGLHYASRRITSHGTKFVCLDGGREVARTYLYVMTNDLHAEPFGYIEDVFVEPRYRGGGLVTRLHEMALSEARRHGCYKIVLSSRSDKPEVHAMYKHLGYEAHGVAFRLDLTQKK